MTDYTKKPTNQGRYNSPQKPQYQQARPPQQNTPVSSSNNTATSVSQLTQQFNLLLILFVALFLFNMFMYWKMRKIEAGGTIAGTQQPAAPGQPAAVQVTDDQIKALFVKENLSFGDPNAKLKFVEFSDPSCPFCHVAAGQNPELSAQMGEQFKPVSAGGTYIPPVVEMKKLVDEGKAAFVMIYQNGHGAGEVATKAMYCADEKDAFWPVHDKLMTNEGYNLINDTIKNDNANAPALAEFISDVIDPAFMTECITSGKYDDRIAKDQQTASTLGVSGTPGFFVNTKNFAGAYSFTDMKADVDAALK